MITDRLELALLGAKETYEIELAARREAIEAFRRAKAEMARSKAGLNIARDAVAAAKWSLNPTEATGEPTEPLAANIAGSTWR